MEEAPENGKESSHSAHGSGMNVLIKLLAKECIHDVGISEVDSKFC
jgi:hypothetical protein